MDLTKVILRPLVTEKSYLLKQQEPAKYAFLVAKKANKTHIKMAFEAIFGITPDAVNTLLRKPKPTRRLAKGKQGYTKLQKIAYITLPPGVSLETEEASTKPTEVEEVKEEGVKNAD